MVQSEKTDLLIIGGGPCGLSAAINAASEGLTVGLLDDGMTLGGQARESNAIENYAGFPDGITGAALTSNMVIQALNFGVTFYCPVKVFRIYRQDKDTLITLTEDGQQFRSSIIILAIGLQYRVLMASNLGSLLGRGIYYGMPPFAIPKNKRCDVAIVGGANSAGQAAVKVAENKNAHVYMFIRKKIVNQMSAYLIDRIAKASNVTVLEECEVTAVYGRQWLERLAYKCPTNPRQEIAMDNMFIFIGAQPRTFWLRDIVQLDEQGYITTGAGVSHDRAADNSVRPSMHYETSMLGVFAAGDVRAYSTKRIGAAVGEGTAVVQQIHQYFDRFGEPR